MNAATVEKALARGPSNIHGTGMFARRVFMAGENIAEISEYERYSEPRLGSVQVERGVHVIDLSVLRWLNHSCQPNARIERDGSAILVQAIRTIGAHEEITCDYDATEDAIPTPFLCRCGDCSGRMMTGRGRES